MFHFATVGVHIEDYDPRQRQPDIVAAMSLC